MGATLTAEALEIRLRGRVQGVGLRPAIWRMARELGLSGEVLNDAEGVLIRAAGPPAAIASLLRRIEREPPPLARVEVIETRPCPAGDPRAGFRILDSASGPVRTQVAPDAGVCAACAAEVFDPLARRHRYPFATCTHCGPRLSVVTGAPYDRARTTMAAFALCPACAREYSDPADRRFHAETTACPACGPRARLVRLAASSPRADALDPRDDDVDAVAALDDVDAVADLILNGAIVAIKGLGGYQLACDATRAETVARLRRRKRRDAKPFALMARDLDVIRRHARVSAAEEAALSSPEAPIVLLAARGERLPAAVAPGLATLGFMLPTTPLHLLVMRRIDRPVVMTSGNLSDEPQVTRDDQVGPRLGEIADHALVHDRAVASRVDDSVARLMGGEVRLVRRARGYAPGAIALPAGFERAPDLLALGGELKATFCLHRGGAAILSQHIGDLDDAATFEDYRAGLDLYAALFDHRPAALACDRHPEYLSSRLARARAARDGVPLFEVGHHHAHIAACLADSGRPLDAAPVLGIALDGLGWGDDDTLWGGEFLLADYRGSRRLATFKPVALLGGDQAAREPWRNLYAHILAAMGWDAFAADFSRLALHRQLAASPRALLDGMLRAGLNVPLASSCGRLFDAFAAAIGVAFDRQAYEGEAPARLEALAGESTHTDDDGLYPFAIGRTSSGLPCVDPAPMWRAALGDLAAGAPAGRMAARFHLGLARAIAAMARELASRSRFDTVALSGGCFHNRVLFEEVARRLGADGFRVLAHTRVPPGDGGLALGQVAVAAARSIQPRPDRRGDAPCASASPAAS